MRIPENKLALVLALYNAITSLPTDAVIGISHHINGDVHVLLFTRDGGSPLLEAAIDEVIRNHSAAVTAHTDELGSTEYVFSLPPNSSPVL